MGDYTYSAPDEADILELLEHMRPGDRREVEAASGDVESAVRQSLQLSSNPVAARIEDGLVCIFGVVSRSLLSTQGTVWMLGTPLVARRAKTVLRETRRFMEWCLSEGGYDHLSNYVDARNAPSLGLLKRVGFTIEPPSPFGVARLPFHYFHMEAENRV